MSSKSLPETLSVCKSVPVSVFRMFQKHKVSSTTETMGTQWVHCNLTL